MAQRTQKWKPSEADQRSFDSLPHVYIPKPSGKKGSTERKQWHMEWFLELLQHGYNYTQAQKRLSLSPNWWTQTKKSHPDWAQTAHDLRDGTNDEWQFPHFAGTFAEFCLHYGGFTLVEHQLRMEKALMDPLGRTILILGHPESGKSTVVNLWYPLFRIARDPNIRIAIVSKNGEQAEALLGRIKRHLTDVELYAETEGNLVLDYNGWKPGHDSGLTWTEKRITVRHRTSGERDPTVQALGITKHIYGTRLDLLILDDALVMENQKSPTTRADIDNWFDAEARSRANQGQVVVCGTRLLPQDLYGYWKKVWKDTKLFRLVVIPAILDEYTENERPSWPEYWVLDGEEIYETIEGESILVGYKKGLRDVRTEIALKSLDRWRLVWQQEDLEVESAIFKDIHMAKAKELGAVRTRGQVMEHEILILGVDPATTGRAFSVLLAVDPETRVRTVIDTFVGSHLGATGIRTDLVYSFLEKYKDHRISTVVVERNFAPTLEGDETFRRRLDVYGATFVNPMTRGFGRHGKWDEEYGVAAMSGLFGSGLMAFASAGAV